MKKQAQEDKQKCELVQSLPELEKRLQELQQNAAASDKPEQLMSAPRCATTPAGFRCRSIPATSPCAG